MKVNGLILFLSLFASAFVQASFIDAGDVLGPYPVIGSAEEKQDIDQLLYYQKTRTAADCAAAELESSGSLQTFFGGKNGLLSEAEMMAVQKKFRMITIKTGTQIFLSKSQFRRPRPYITHPEVKPCISLESSKSYPSGHTTLARVYAKLLAVAYPERGLQFQQRADQVAFNRILGGVHHPSDIVAGKMLGDALVEEFLSDDEFRYELEHMNY